MISIVFFKLAKKLKDNSEINLKIVFSEKSLDLIFWFWIGWNVSFNSLSKTLI